MNNLEMMRKRFEFQGGVAQEDRMIKDKYKTFLRTLKYSYQGCDVQLADDEVAPIYRALINPNKVKQDYDDKILSIDYNTGFGPGDVFKWVGTNSYWLIYLEELTEDAYFRGQIRLCRYIIKFKDKNGNVKQTWAAIRGPVETQIESIQKNQIRIDRPNLSLNILIPKNEDTEYFFNRYSRFLFAGKAWRIQANDTISIKNVIEVNAEEYYIDRDTDDVEQEVADGLTIEPIDPNPDTDFGIIGNTFIKPMISENYVAPEAGGDWSIKEQFPVCIKTIDDSTVSVTWKKSVSGQFTLQWSKGETTAEKIIVVESLF